MKATPESLILHSKVAAVVSDPRQHDNPIVACNQAFAELTGYRCSEVVGRNCRFLGGELTDRKQIARLRDAITQQRPVMAELINYRKNGTRFLNAVMIAPLFGDSGELEYFLGSQVAVDERGAGRRERARSQIARLTLRQRQVLAALVEGRLNKQIAYELGLTERTVKMHRAATLRALDVKTVAEAIRLAVEAEL